MNNESFASADVDFPAKLLANMDIYEMIMTGNLRPYHLQLNPTNKCNMKCEFCSCRDEDRTQELSLERIKAFCIAVPSLRAITITGGGEPTLHKHFDDMVEYFFASGLKMGLVTNGYTMADIYDNTIGKLTWCRISLSIESGDKLAEAVQYALENVDINWAFSFVCSPDIKRNVETIRKFYMMFGERITHMRVVGNILEPDDRVALTKAELKIPAPKIIWQGRTTPTRGSKECRIAMIKPVLAASGKLYPCCGAQYYKRGIDRKYADGLCMGDITDTAKAFDRQYFDGSVCDVCFYSGYNNTLQKMSADYEHLEFI